MSIAPDLESLLRDGRQALECGKPAQAAAVVERVLAASRLHAETAIEARALLLGSLVNVRVDNATAARQALDACAIGASLADPVISAEGLLACGRVAAAVGDFDMALRDLEAALDLATSCGAIDLLCQVLNMTAWTLADVGQPQRSLELHRQVADLAASHDKPFLRLVAEGSVASRHLDLAEAALAASDEMRANELLLKSVGLHEASLAAARDGSHHSVALHLLVSYGASLALLGEGVRAEAAFDEHQKLAESLGQPFSTVRIALLRAKLLRDQGRHDSALVAANAGIALGKALNAWMQVASLHEFIAEQDEAAGRFESALRHYKTYHALRSTSLTERAEQRSKVLAVRLDTARALAVAEAERSRAQRLVEANRSLVAVTEQLTERAVTDALTGLANRGEIDQSLARLHAEARLAGNALWVAFLDLDHFKSINDRFSHAIGDQVLRQVGSLLKQQLRDRDVVGRYGGEEFLIVMRDVTKAFAEAVCERLRQSIERSPWEAVQHGLQVTASFGLCDVAQDTAIETGLGRADILLYRAKKTGRNRVCVD